MKTYTCELCGFQNEWTGRGSTPRWCPDDRIEGRRRARQARNQPTPQIRHALETTLTAQRLAIETAIHALILAALSRQLGWDDRGWMQAALDELTAVRPVAEVFAA